MADTQTTIPFIDGAGNTREQLSIIDATDKVAPQTVLRTNGTVVSDAAPLPTADAVAAGYLASLVTNTTGGATAAAQATGNAALAAIEASAAAGATAAGQASALTQATASATALGAPADAAWTGSGSSSVVAALKALWGALTGVLSTKAGTLSVLGYQQIASLTASTALTVPATATQALISAEGSAVRWRDDGTAPTASIGMPLAAGASAYLYTGALAAIRFIETAPSATLNISYYK